jgi:hypothetical protein
MTLVPDLDRKQPSEREYLAIDFSKRLGESDVVTSITECKCYDEDGTDVSLDMIESPVISGSNIKFWRKGGTSGKMYALTVKIETEQGAKLEEDLKIFVEEEGEA